MLRMIRSKIRDLQTTLIDEHFAMYYLNHKGVQFDKSSITLHGVPYVSRASNSQIKLGTGIVINSRERSNPLALDHATSFITYENSRIMIGDHCSMSGAIIISQTEIIIGDYTMIGANTRIYDTDFHPTDPEMRRAHPTKGAKTKPIIIGSNVFIGCHVHILKGVTIADNAVIPAGSVIYQDFPGN